MTKQKLLRNLRGLPMTKHIGYTYKVITDRRDTNGHEIYIMVSNWLEFPVYLLRYRLDLDFLANYYEIGAIRMYAQDLTAFENATKRISK